MLWQLKEASSTDKTICDGCQDEKVTSCWREKDILVLIWPIP